MVKLFDDHGLELAVKLLSAQRATLERLLAPNDPLVSSALRELDRATNAVIHARDNNPEE